MGMNEAELSGRLDGQRPGRIAIAPDEDEPAGPGPGPRPQQAPPRRDMGDVEAQPRRPMHNRAQQEQSTMQPPPQRQPQPQRDDRRNGQSQRAPDPPQRQPQPQMEPAPATPYRSGLIDRGRLNERYNIAFGLFGVVCEINSFYTTIVGVYGLWGIMFGETRLAYLFGFIIAVSIFLGEIFNSDFHDIVMVEDEETGEEMPKLVERPNYRRNYYLWLTPDAGFTLIFWIAPFVRMFVHIFFRTDVDVTSVQGVADLLGQAWVGQSWGVFLAFFFLCLVPATLLASAWSVVSAYYPEKAALGPRTRDYLKERVRELSQLGAAVRM